MGHHNDFEKLVDIEASISNIEDAIRHHQCPDSIKEDVKIVIRYARESLKSLNAPSNESLMAQLYKRAARAGAKLKDMTIVQIAEVIKDIDLRTIFPQKSKRDEKRRKRRGK